MAARSGLAALALVAGLAGCSGSAAGTAARFPRASATTAAPTTTGPLTTRLDVIASEYQFQTVRAINLAAGEITVTLHNEGTEPHHGQLMRLHDGVTDEQIADAIADDPSVAPLLKLGDLMGGPGMIPPGGTARSTQRLPPGSYLMFCLVRASSGETHAFNDMIAKFEVTSQRARSNVPRPTADLGLTDSGFQLPSPFPRHGVLRVTNHGKQPHEITFLALPQGRGREALDRYLKTVRSPQQLQPPLPLRSAGGVAALAPGQAAIVPVDLKAGNYLAICLVRGADGLPHALHGMVKLFTVR